MQCPQCAATLEAAEYEGVPIHTCNTCGGEFVGGEEFRRIVDNRKERFDAAMKDELAESKPSFGAVSTQPKRALPCPACGQAMKVANYAGDSGIFVDRCDVCSGLWLDHEELEKVQIVMERWADEAGDQIQAIAGELETARRKAADSTTGSFSGSRFAFVNALINRLLDAA
jgi:Zn-finger nucleic acid-binding protein